MPWRRCARWPGRAAPGWLSSRTAGSSWPPGQAGNLTEGLLRLLVVIRDAQQDGSWARLKICGNPDCQWAFFDRSHSRQGSWCDMSSCGNLIKNRNLRARRRAS